VAVLHEQMTTMRWVGFVAVWVALMIFTFEAVQHRRRQLRLTVEASAV
jgi:chloramphenicol-sensitive protein RarD